MATAEERARKAAYMRAWNNTPEQRAAARERSRTWYRENRERVLADRRERAGAGPRRRRWTDADVLQAIRDLADSDGVAACPGRGSLPGIAAARFGSWKSACEAAGVTSAWSRALRPTAKYSTVHSRLQRERGTPDECERCEKSGPGRYEWALNLDVPRPLYNEDGFPYSLDLSDYRRLCAPCHRRQDRTRTRPQ